MKTTVTLFALAALLLLPALAGCGGSTTAPMPAAAATRNVTWEGHNPPPVK